MVVNYARFVHLNTIVDMHNKINNTVGWQLWIKMMKASTRESQSIQIYRCLSRFINSKHPNAMIL